MVEVRNVLIRQPRQRLLEELSTASNGSLEMLSLRCRSDDIYFALQTGSLLLRASFAVHS